MKEIFVSLRSFYCALSNELMDSFVVTLAMVSNEVQTMSLGRVRSEGCFVLVNLGSLHWLSLQLHLSTFSADQETVRTCRWT